MPEYYFWGPAKLVQPTNPLIVWFRAVRPQGAIGGQVGYNPFSTNPPVVWRPFALSNDPAIATITASGTGVPLQSTTLPEADVAMPDRLVFVFEGSPSAKYHGSSNLLPDPVNPTQMRKALRVSCSGDPLVGDAGGGLFPFSTSEIQGAQRIDIWTDSSEDPVEPSRPPVAATLAATGAKPSVPPEPPVSPSRPYLEVAVKDAHVVSDSRPLILRMSRKAPATGDGPAYLDKILSQMDPRLGAVVTVGAPNPDWAAHDHVRASIVPQCSVEGACIEWVLCGEWTWRIDGRNLAIHPKSPGNPSHTVRIVKPDGCFET